jgi:branched-chain amino acid transport system permease protein
MTEFLQLLVAGLATGTVYAGLALALSVVHAGSGILNFAQGQQAAVAAFGVLTLTGRGWSLWLALPAVVVASALLGAALERVLVRPVEGGEPLALFTVTAALLLGLAGLTSILWDTDQHALASPFGDGVVGVGPVTVTTQQLGSCLVVAVVMTATGLFLRRTRSG